MLRPVATVCFTLAFPTGAVTAAELVQPAELGRSLFDSRPIATTDAKGRTAELVFAPGGALTRTTASGETAGTWRLSADGFCMQLGETRRESCYVVLKRDDGSFSALSAGQPFTWKRMR